MANSTAQKRSLSKTVPLNIRTTGKGVIGAIGKPPGFKTVVHPPEKSSSDSPNPNSGSGRIGSCGTVYR